jgi:hypothetical protein
MSIIYCYYVIDVICLSEPVSISDIGVLHVKHLQISIALSE